MTTTTEERQIKAIVDHFEDEGYKEKPSSAHIIGDNWVRVIRTWTRVNDDEGSFFIIEERKGSLDHIGKLNSFVMMNYVHYAAMRQALTLECPHCAQGYPHDDNVYKFEVKEK